MGERLVPVALAPGDLMTPGDPGRVIEPRFARVVVDAPAGVSPPAGLTRLLAVFTYRPRWRFTLKYQWGLGGPELSGPGYPWVLHITTWVEDAYHPGQWGEGHMEVVVPFGDLDDGAWLRWLHGSAIADAERHESDEWFCVDGVRVFDPHKTT